MPLRVNPDQADQSIDLVLHGEIVPAVSGAVVLRSSRHEAFVRSMAARATLCSGHAWVQPQHCDDEFVAQIREVWSDVAPGWVACADKQPDPIQNLREQFCHSAISHHVSQLGHIMVRDRQLAAIMAIRESVDPRGVASKTILAYLGFGDQPCRTTIARALLDKDGTLPSTELRLNTELYDDDIESYVATTVRGSQHAADLV